MVTVVLETYDIQVLTVAVGTTVIWVNKDAEDHTATSDANPPIFDVPLKGNGTGQFTFTQAGTYPYHCAYHTSMHATIVVK